MEQHETERWADLARYVAGDGSPEERATIESWVAADPRREEAVRVMRAEWGAEAADLAASDVDGAWTRFMVGMSSGTRLRPRDVGEHTGRILVNTERHAPQARASRERLNTTAIRWPRFAATATAVAAAALVIVGGTTLWRAGQRADMPANRAHGPAHVYATAVGQRASVTLADGSRVMLAPASKLTVIDGFGARTRTVTLDGEAYFSVTPDESAPFVVQTGAVTTRVLGTAFAVRSYASDVAVRVAVVSGRVASGNTERGTPLVLTAGMVAQVTDSSARVTSRTDADALTAWTRGQLVFDNVPAAEMLAAVGRWYGYEFKLADTAIASQRVSAAFKSSEPSEALAIIQHLLGVRATSEGSVITLRLRAPTERSDDRHTTPARRQGRETFSTPTGVGK